MWRSCVEIVLQVKLGLLKRSASPPFPIHRCFQEIVYVSIGHHTQHADFHHKNPERPPDELHVSAHKKLSKSNASANSFYVHLPSSSKSTSTSLTYSWKFPKVERSIRVALWADYKRLVYQGSLLSFPLLINKVQFIGRIVGNHFNEVCLDLLAGKAFHIR